MPAMESNRAIRPHVDKKARDIISHRQKNGPFESVDALAQVSGIGIQTVDRSRGNLTVKSNGN